MLEGIRKIHLIGIGGAGMRAIANVLINQGYEVSGSDVNMSPTIERFMKMGARISIGQAAENVEGVDVVVVSTAIPANNVELVAAHNLSIPVIHRSDIIKAVLDNSYGIAVAGTHGKTTTTSMIGQIFEEVALDPTIIIGGEVDYLNGNSKLGHGKYSIVEADESDGSFTKLNPKLVVITNVEEDHMDYYKTIDKLLDSFKVFIEKLPEEDGTAIVCGDNNYLLQYSKAVERKFLTYGFNPYNDFIAQNIRYQEGLLVYDVHHKGDVLTTITLQVPGMHNVLNSLGAFVAAYTEEVPLETIQRALYKFIGAKRRFETKGKAKGIWVVDDYAHHPTEIAATLKAAKGMEKYRVICVFQPHRYTRTNLLLKEFSEAFKAADIVVMTDIYSAGESPIEGIDGMTIPRAVKEATGQDVLYVPNVDDVPSFLLDLVQENDLVMTMGAGSINKYGPILLELIEERYGK